MTEKYVILKKVQDEGQEPVKPEIENHTAFHMQIFGGKMNTCVQMLCEAIAKDLDFCITHLFMRKWSKALILLIFLLCRLWTQFGSMYSEHKTPMAYISLLGTL